MEIEVYTLKLQLKLIKKRSLNIRLTVYIGEGRLSDLMWSSERNKLKYERLS